MRQKTIYDYIDNITKDALGLKSSGRMMADSFRVYRIVTGNEWDIDTSGQSSSYEKLYKIKLVVEDPPDNAFTQFIVNINHVVDGLTASYDVCYDDPLAIYVRVYADSAWSSSSHVKIKFMSIGLLDGNILIQEI